MIQTSQHDEGLFFQFVPLQQTRNSRDIPGLILRLVFMDWPTFLQALVA